VAPVRYHPDLDHRRSTRLPTWDYREAGAYFVTICTQDRSPLFGKFVVDELVLNRLGGIVKDVWRRVVGPAQSPGEFVVMPNHVHSIIWIQRESSVGRYHNSPPATTVGAEQLPEPEPASARVQNRSFTSILAVAQPLRPDFTPPRRGLRDGLEPGSLFVIVRTFKSAVAKRINNVRRTPGARVWQDDYHDRIIRDDRELDRARKYIVDNPHKWAEDKHNPGRVPQRR